MSADIDKEIMRARDSAKVIATIRLIGAINAMDRAAHELLNLHNQKAEVIDMDIKQAMSGTPPPVKSNVINIDKTKRYPKEKDMDQAMAKAYKTLINYEKAVQLHDLYTKTKRNKK